MSTLGHWSESDPTPKPKSKGDRPKNDELCRRLQGAVESIAKSNDELERRKGLKFDLELYMGEQLPDLDQLGSSKMLRAHNVDAEHQVFNASYALVNTVLNRVTSFRARAQFLPNGGNWKARRAARDMTDMSDAWAEQQNYQDEAAFAFRDSLTGDAGVLKFYEEDGAIKVGRFPSWEFLVEYKEGEHREPMCLYHVRQMPISMAARNLGVEPSEIASTGTWDHSASLSYGEGTVLVADAWTRGPKGRHAQIVSNHVVVDREWEYDGFPASVNRFDWRPTGFWGIGGITPIRSIQLELNELQVTLREAHRRMASAIISTSEDESAEAIPTNDYVSMVRYKIAPPNIQNPAAVHPGIYKYAETLYKQAFETWGVSQQVASGTKPTGANSAVAIRESVELQTDRLALLSQRWERMRIDAATWWWRLTRDMAKRTGEKPKWRGISKGQWKELVFGDLDQEYEIRAYPSSIFGQSIAGRFDRATELIEGGWLSREDAMKSLDVPDLSPVMDLALSESYLMEKIVDDVLETGTLTMPPRYLDKQKVWAYAKSRYYLALTGDGDYDPPNISKLTTLIDAMGPPPEQAAAAVAAGPPQPPTPPAPPPGLGGPPGAVPGPVPGGPAPMPPTGGPVPMSMPGGPGGPIPGGPPQPPPPLLA
jgi:hypothetical protein